MADQSDIKSLEMRIIQLESQLRAAQMRKPVDISADELKAYVKVREAISLDPACGINECWPCIIYRCIYRCITVCIRCIHRCDVECICGPCLAGGGGFGGGFSQMGG